MNTENTAVLETPENQEMVETPVIENQEPLIQIPEPTSDEVDMGAISEEDPIPPRSSIIDVSTNIAAAKVKKAVVTSAAKMPILHDWPKRGLNNFEFTINNKAAPYAQHHQKQLILDLLEGIFGGKTDIVTMVKMVESNPEYYMRLKSNQHVYKCITYHVNQLLDLEVLKKV